MAWNHPALLKIGPRVSVFPIVHGSGDFAWEVRRLMLQGNFDAVAIPLPASFQKSVEDAVLNLPTPAVVIQPFHEYVPAWDEPHDHEHDHDDEGGEPWKSEADPLFEPAESDYAADPTGEPEDALPAEESDDWEVDLNASYVPIDPCQPTIAAIRTAIGEHIPRFFIDLETNRYEAYQQQSADPYCLKRVSIERFAAAMLPHIERPTNPQRIARIRYMAYQLRQLSIDFKNILLVCDFHDWPWIREAYFQPDPNPPQNEWTETPKVYGVRLRSLYFLFGELPFTTALYEHARMTLGDDSELSIDGVKRLLLTARAVYQRRLGTSARKITPLLLRQCLQYIRNLTLMERRLTPDLIHIVQAAQQIAGDTYAYYVLNTAKRYVPDRMDRLEAGVATKEYSEYDDPEPNASDSASDDSRDPSANSGTNQDSKEPLPLVKMGLGQLELPTDEIVGAVNRLSGVPLVWRHLELRPHRPRPKDQKRWLERWDPGYQCSYPPEDARIEQFRSAVFSRAKQIMGADAVKSEKFTSSVMDGIDIRETLRHWYDGDLYVKINPQIRSGMDAAVMLFDTPADPRDYTWRTTWFAEHGNESTLAFYATDFKKNPVGPGICSATYGGAMFLFPPRRIPEIWREPMFDFTTTLEERLIAAACRFATQRHVAILSPLAPGYSWKRIAKLYGKRLVHVPLGQYSDSTVQQLRLVHVLNGMEVRSYASSFIQRR
ncbi:MAG: hypothetical protein JNL67_02580 [Planctomycetaceae bacterium]|nr:hypothetical protein [Planctomycetaceae bacterium]